MAILQHYGSETAFAKVLGISRAQLTHIIVGRNPGWHIREKASSLLGHSEDFLFEGGYGENNTAAKNSGSAKKYPR